jgi:hypothetical protein
MALLEAPDAEWVAQHRALAFAVAEHARRVFPGEAISRRPAHRLWALRPFTDALLDAAVAAHHAWVEAMVERSREAVRAFALSRVSVRPPPPDVIRNAADAAAWWACSVYGQPGVTDPFGTLVAVAFLRELTQAGHPAPAPEATPENPARTPMTGQRWSEFQQAARSGTTDPEVADGVRLADAWEEEEVRLRRRWLTVREDPRVVLSEAARRVFTLRWGVGGDDFLPLYAVARQEGVSLTEMEHRFREARKQLLAALAVLPGSF